MGINFSQTFLEWLWRSSQCLDLFIASSLPWSHVCLPNGLLSAAEKWQRTHLNTGRAKKAISCEKNVWPSSHVMQWCWWADKGFANWILPFLWHSGFFSPQCGSKKIWRIIVTSCWPLCPGQISPGQGAVSCPNTKHPMKNHYSSFTLSEVLSPLRLIYLSVSSLR